MDGLGGKHGWQWIFLIEGLITVLVAVASFWVVQDFPDAAKFLKPEESMSLLLPLLFCTYNSKLVVGAFLVHRLQSDQQFSAGGERFKMDYIWQCLRDPKTYMASK